MPLFAIISGEVTPNAEFAVRDLQAWLDSLTREEYALLEEELEAEPTAEDRPMVGRVNAVIDRLHVIYTNGEAIPWKLVVKNKL